MVRGFAGVLIVFGALTGCGESGPGMPLVDAGLDPADAAVALDAAVAIDAGEPEPDGGSEPPEDGGPPVLDAAIDDPTGPESSRVQVITFNWPSRYGPGGVDSNDRALWSDLSGRASVMALQEAGWVAGHIRSRGWEVHRPNPPGDDDDQPTGNFVVWDPSVWQVRDRGAFQQNPYTRIQAAAVGPTRHRPKYVVWVELRNRDDGTVWTFASVHFVPSKHLGGAALELWERQRDRMLLWLSRRAARTVVMGDFNAQPSDAPCAPIRDAAGIHSAPSHGDRQIDWVVRKPVLEGIRVAALAHMGQSDHRPVRSVVRWTR